MTRLRNVVAAAAFLLASACGPRPAKVTPAEAAEMAEKAETLRETGDMNGALDLLLKAEEAGNRDAALRAALILDGTGRTEQALIQFQKVLKDDSSNPIAQQAVSDILARRGATLDEALKGGRGSRIIDK